MRNKVKSFRLSKLIDILIVWGGVGVAFYIFFIEGMSLMHLLALTLYILAIVYYMDDNYGIYDK